jgi:hypothetical protein
VWPARHYGSISVTVSGGECANNFRLPDHTDAIRAASFQRSAHYSSKWDSFRLSCAFRASDAANYYASKVVIPTHNFRLRDQALTTGAFSRLDLDGQLSSVFWMLLDASVLLF